MSNNSRSNIQQFLDLNSQNLQIQKAIIQYQQKIYDQSHFDQSNYNNNVNGQNSSQQCTSNNFNNNIYNYAPQNNLINHKIQLKNNNKPIRMFKDLMELKNENKNKKNIIKQLQALNAHLITQYQQCIQNNNKIQNFLQKIQCTFKNDHFAQKANQIMNQAKKTLYRQAKDSQNAIKKITKGTQGNFIQQYKSYILGLMQEKQRLQALFLQATKQNKRKKQNQDFNHVHQTKYNKSQKLINLISQFQFCKSKIKRNQYFSQKLTVSNQLKIKQIQTQKKQNGIHLNSIKQMRLIKEGLQYQIQILKRKRKEKNKIEQQISNFQNQIIMKKKNINRLQKQLKQKIKTYDYMSEWTKQLKGKLQERRDNHISLKSKYQQKINTLSKQFDQWNRKYKFQLAEEGTKSKQHKY